MAPSHALGHNSGNAPSQAPASDVQSIKETIEETIKGSSKTSAKTPLHVTLAYSPAPRVVHELALTLPAGAKLRDALAAGAGDARFADLQTAAALVLGIWGHKASLDHALHDNDRIEAYRPLRVDPKVARRERFAKQGARTSGLFAKRRPGAKPGY